MFDTVFDSLLDEAKRSGLPDLSGRIAPVETAPRRLIKRLATYTNIASAGTLLAQSPRLSTGGLGEIANIKGNALMLAISARKDLTEPLTYILIREGDQQVATAAASNDTARLSPAGVNTLFERARAPANRSARHFLLVRTFRQTCPAPPPSGSYAGAFASQSASHHSSLCEAEHESAGS
jgi:uncharacterized protein (DUF2336 family)